MYFDHYLATNWEQYHSQPLCEFSSEFYDKIRGYFNILPDNIQKFLTALIRYNWFEAYSSIQGLQLILLQMEKRTQFTSKLGASTQELINNYTYFNSHFTEFMQEVILFSRNEIQTL